METQKLELALKVISAECGNITMLQLQIILYVMSNETTNASDLSLEFKTTRASVSRNIFKFRDNNANATLQIFRCDANELDSREYNISLTTEGQELRRKIRKI